MMAAIPITIITGFLGSGKTTLILNLIPQLPATYRLALLKNEFGDVAIDSQLASSSSISGVRELLNGCICCNLVGQLGDALSTLRTDVRPDRIVIETSGSAFPATLAMEVNRLGRETGHFELDGVVVVLDVENWKGYEDTSYTAKMQARYTDLVVFNKWEDVGEMRFDECLDRLGDLEIEIAWVKSDRGMVSKDVVLGIDGGLARYLSSGNEQDGQGHIHITDGIDSVDGHGHAHGHQGEVEVLSVNLSPSGVLQLVDIAKLESFLSSAPKDEIYRIKAILMAHKQPISSDTAQTQPNTSSPSRYILNWAFGRWTFTPLLSTFDHGSTTRDQGDFNSAEKLRMTVVLARGEAQKWKKRIEAGGLVALEGGENLESLHVTRIS